MAMTVASMESEILNRLGAKAAQANLSALTNGTNPDLKTAIRRALRYVGRAPSDPTTVVDSDLATVPAGKAEVYMDAAVLESLYVIQGRTVDGFDQKVGEQQEWLHQLMTDTAAMIEEYKSRLPKLNLGGFAVGQSSQSTTVPGDPLRPRDRLNPYTWPYPS